MTWGSNGPARPTTEKYRNNPYWDKVEEKKRKEKELKDDDSNPFKPVEVKNEN